MLGFDLSSVASLQRFDKEFEGLGKIGTGGFSIVDKVRNIRDKRIYALKMLKIKPSQLKNRAADYLQKTLSQAKVLSGLDHPNILQYYGCWVSADLKKPEDFQQQQEQSHQEQEQLQLVMQQYDQSSCGFQFEKRSQSEDNKKKFDVNKNIVYHENLNDNIFGTDLNKYKQIRVYLLSELGQNSLQKFITLRNQSRRMNQIQQINNNIQSYKMILDIIQGLIYLHNQKVIHRDIKPQNIIIDKNKRCKIIDFGLAKKVRNLKSLTIQKFHHEVVHSDQTEQRHSSSVGTKIFSSPEQSNSENYDHRTDIYSLAMLIAQMLTPYNTAHQQGNLLRNLRDRKLDQLKIDLRLKSLLYKSLSQQKLRPDLKQLRSCIRKLLKQEVNNLKLKQSQLQGQKNEQEKVKKEENQQQKDIKQQKNLK